MDTHRLTAKTREGFEKPHVANVGDDMLRRVIPSCTPTAKDQEVHLQLKTKRHSTTYTRKHCIYVTLDDTTISC